MIAEDIARVAYEVNRAYCLALGDASQAPWEDAPEWQRSSAVNGAKDYIFSAIVKSLSKEVA